jgi:small nuclear ribonucleoprotein (snRNP)-like protein
MNLVIDEAEEVYVGKVPKPRRPIGSCIIFLAFFLQSCPYAYMAELGRILLKGDNITLIQPVQN